MGVLLLAWWEFLLVRGPQALLAVTWVWLLALWALQGLGEPPSWERLLVVVGAQLCVLARLGVWELMCRRCVLGELLQHPPPP